MLNCTNNYKLNIILNSTFHQPECGVHAQSLADIVIVAD